MKSAVAIRHVAFEDMGSFAGVLSAQNISLRYLEAGVDDLTQIDPFAPDLLIVLGGPIGAYEEENYPFVLKEISLLEARLKADLPTLGICLGAQMMARALGARVYPGPVKEIGWSPLTLTEAGDASPLSYMAGDKTAVLHWHGDTFDLPSGATLLASTEVCHHQAFSWERRSLAFQCHPEVRAADLERWYIGHACEIAVAKLSVRRLREETAHWGPILEEQGTKCFLEWLKSIGL